MRFQAKLKKLTKEQGLSSRDIEVKFSEENLGDVSDTTVRRWINGENEPSLSQAYGLSKILGVPIGYLADDEVDEVHALPRTEVGFRIAEMVQRLGPERALDRLIEAEPRMTESRPDVQGDERGRRKASGDGRPDA